MARKRKDQLTSPQMDALFGDRPGPNVGASERAAVAQHEKFIAERILGERQTARVLAAPRTDCPSCGHTEDHEPKTANLSSGKCPTCGCLSGWQKPKTEEL